MLVYRSLGLTPRRHAPAERRPTPQPHDDNGQTPVARTETPAPSTSENK